MALSGPVIVVADDGAPVREALACGGNLPTRELCPDNTATITKLGPSAVVLADRAAGADHQRAVAAQFEAHGPIVPIMAVMVEGDAPASPLVLPILACNVAAQLVPRLRAALRVRALHATVLRRLEDKIEDGDAPEFPQHDPLDDTTVLVAGRGRNYPALTVAIGERMGLIGALSLDTARSYLGARDIDGVVIGDGFNRSMVEDFMDELGADPRWRGLPVIVPRDAHEPDPRRMPHVDRLGGDPQAVAAHIVPLARLHAFASRLKRIAASLDQKGTLAPDTGLMTPAAFMGQLERAATSAATRDAGLSLARFSFERLPSRASLDAARITGRLLRASDIACRDEDGTILIAFTETDLVTAHVVARRIASVLKHTTLALGTERTRLGPTISLAAFRARDTVETLLARTIDQRSALSG
jgi:hypothetical protein